MDTKLKLLISTYEEEKLELQNRIDTYVQQAEFLLAHHHSEALAQVDRRLQTLWQIADKPEDERASRRMEIARLQKQIESESQDYMQEYYQKRLLYETDALARLDLVPKLPMLPGEETFFNETLKKLLAQKIKNLKLILKKSDNIYLNFSYSNKVLKVTLPHLRQLIKDWKLHDDQVNALINLGFDLPANKTKLTLKLTGDKAVILDKVKVILSKIAFEVFYFKQFDCESYVQFTEK